MQIIKCHEPKYGFIFHCFQPNLEVLDEIMEMGGFISVGTPITRPTAKKSLEVIKNVDISRLLIETDYPYMCDDVHQDGYNIFHKVMELRGLTYQELDNILDDNTRRLFRRIN